MDIKTTQRENLTYYKTSDKQHASDIPMLLAIHVHMYISEQNISGIDVFLDHSLPNR